VRKEFIEHGREVNSFVSARVRLVVRAEVRADARGLYRARRRDTISACDRPAPAATR
jgi:hypothetical protein